MGIDYHVQYYRHYYSVPYEMLHKDVEILLTENKVETLYRSQNLTVSRAKGSYPKFPDVLTKTQLLIIHDWLCHPLSDIQTQDALEIRDVRYDRNSTIMASQDPMVNRHERFAAPTLLDAIMDTVVHDGYRLEITGESMRKRKSLTHAGHKGI